jgi:DNA polymerase-3 subunit gamma/tau
MAYQVLYRKYRPRDFSEVAGQDHIVGVIRRQIEAGRVAHAYLFSGPRGVGKTTIARLIAKAVNCERAGKAGAPCNNCVSCEAFNAGQALNLIEIDAASNRGIDEIRELREAVRYAPAGGEKKVYIIDEVHQLTKEAFNALLKTLEEPPAHAVFVLATTELDKVPQTIISRTQHFDFRRPREEVIAKRLMMLAEREGVILDADAASSIAFVAEGALRDAEGMLGKILAVEDKRVTLAEVEEILGIPRREALNQLFGFVASGDLKSAIGLLNQLYADGYEMEYLLKLLISLFREALLEKTMSARADHEERMLAEGKDATKTLSRLTPDQLADAIVELIDAIPLARRSPIPQLPLELAFVKIIYGKS